MASSEKEDLLKTTKKKGLRHVRRCSRQHCQVVWKECKNAVHKWRKNAVKQQLSEAGIDAELLALAEDADLRELCPVTFNLTRKWQLKEALGSTRGMCFPYIFFFGCCCCFSPQPCVQNPRVKKSRPKNICRHFVVAQFFSFPFLSLLKIPPLSPAKLGPSRPSWQLARWLQEANFFLSSRFVYILPCHFHRAPCLKNCLFFIKQPAKSNLLNSWTTLHCFVFQKQMRPPKELVLPPQLVQAPYLLLIQCVYGFFVKFHCLIAFVNKWCISRPFLKTGCKVDCHFIKYFTPS